MYKIWKWSLTMTDRTDLDMPYGAEILDVQMQHGDLTIWALVNPENDIEMRRFAVHGTGHSIPEDRRSYIGTVQICDGDLIFHVFELHG